MSDNDDPLKIAVASANEIWQMGVVHIFIDKKLLASWFHASNFRNVRQVVAEQQPDFLIIDEAMPGNLPVLLREVRVIQPQMEVLVAGQPESKAAITKILNSGARAYVDSGKSLEMISALRALLKHKPYLGPEISQCLFGKNPEGHSVLQGIKLTDREKETWSHLVKGHSTQQIAKELGLSRKTVESHLASLRSKVGAKTIAELRKMASLSGEEPKKG